MEPINTIWEKCKSAIIQVVADLEKCSFVPCYFGPILTPSHFSRQEI